MIPITCFRNSLDTDWDEKGDTSFRGCKYARRADSFEGSGEVFPLA